MRAAIGGVQRLVFFVAVKREFWEFHFGLFSSPMWGFHESIRGFLPVEIS